MSEPVSPPPLRDTARLEPCSVLRDTPRRGSHARARPRALALRACALATALAGFALSALAAEEEVLEVRQVAPGHFVHVGRQEDMTEANGGDVANGGFVIGTRSVAVIDPGGGTAAARALRAALRARTTLPVSHVILTHFHPDHVLGASVFGDTDTLVAHANYTRSRTQRGAFYLDRFAALVAPDGASADADVLLVPTREVGVGEPYEIELGDRELVVRAYPTAHTDNDISVFDPASATLWAGDLLFAGRTPSLDGSLPGWLAVMDELAALTPRVLVPGHGEPGDFTVIAARQRRYLESLLDSTRRAIAAGVRLAEALAEAERVAAIEEDWLLFALQHPTNVTRAWTELEWE